MVVDSDPLGLHADPAVTAIAFYAFGVVALGVWESIVVPWLGAATSLPSKPRRLSRSDRDDAWIVPWTADLPVPPPDYATLCALGSFKVGACGAVDQLITARHLDAVRSTTRAVSPEWSDYYGRKIVIYKVRRGGRR